MTDPPLPGASLTRAPQDWQILQQDAHGFALMKLEGIYRNQPRDFRVEARLVRERDGSPVTSALDWTPAALGPERAWSLTLEKIPAGGLYRVETRVWRTNFTDTRPMRGDYVHHLGVGDLWVVAGQSNSSGTGTGPVDDPPTLGVHLFGNDEQWKLACHPLEDATRSRHPITVHGVFQAHSPWIAFGRRLQEELGYPIGLIPTALGGSPLALWQSEAALYQNMREMVRLSGDKVRGIVWYQGESDCNPTASADYGARFQRFVEAVRKDLGASDLPILTAQLGRYTEGGVDQERHRSWSRIREAQRQSARTLPRLALLPSLDLPLCDDIHLSAAANVTLGHRFATEALRLVHGRELPTAGIHLEKAEWRAGDHPTLRLTFQRPVAGWCRVGPVEDFRLEDEQGQIRLASTTPDDAGWVDLYLERAPVGTVMVHAHYGCFPAAALRDRDQRPVFAFSILAPAAA